MVRPGVPAPGLCRTPVEEVSDVTERTCSVDSCTAEARVRGMCRPHYMRWYNGRPLDARWRQPNEGPCKVDGCAEPSKTLGLCKMHYQRHLRGQELEAPRGRARKGTRAVCTIDGCGLQVNGKGLCRRHYHLWTAYGLTPEAFDKLFESQGRKCRGCGRTEPTKHGWSVDHCHINGHVRAILCNRCNTALGMVDDDPDTLRRLAELAEARR